MIDVGTDGQAVVEDQFGGVFGKVHTARQVLKRDQHGIAFLKETLQKPTLTRVRLGVGFEQAVNGLVAARIQTGVEQAAVVVEHQRQVGRRGLVHVALGQKNRATKRERQIVLKDAVAVAPVLGVGEVGQTVVARFGAKCKVVYIAAQGAGDLHEASNPLKSRRANALILYVRRTIGAHDVIVPKLVGEIGSRTTAGNEVLDPGVVLVVFGLGGIGQRDRSADES